MLLILSACGSKTQNSTTESVNSQAETVKNDDKIFLSKHIDDTGVKAAIKLGHGQVLDQTFYDKKHDITVHFNRVLTDEKETKLLLTYQSEKNKFKKKHYIDLFEGVSSIYLIVGDERKKLDNVGWGSNYYDSKEKQDG
ncbi:hypothetical protein RCO48_17170 [Peribacillus frigoritolerans]|nr:hypothetical protein [Peribacillus frigoritolerans]